ncbi:MAG: TraB/GumN family protein [Rectinema sp.]
MSQTVRHIQLKERVVILAGTAHISNESVDEVTSLIASEKPGRVCIELDQPRYASMIQDKGWESLDITKVLREGNGFLMMANLALSGFQKRMGAGVDAKPGAEMLAAVKAAEAEGIPWSLCDRDIQTTLKRAWAKSNLWNRSKLIASLASSSFSGEKLSAEEIEALKERNELDQMMDELAEYLPSVKEVLIDERDRYLATKIYLSPEPTVVAVVGAGHMNGIETWLLKLDSGEARADLSDIDAVPRPSIWGKVAGWAIPVLIVGLIVLGFFRSGVEASLALALRWILTNGSLAALGSLLCLAHPVTIIVSFVAAPLATLNPLVGVGLFAGLSEAFLRKPTVRDLESLGQDVTTFKGIYRNRVTHILLIFFMSSIGGMIGNFISVPILASGVIG